MWPARPPCYFANAPTYIPAVPYPAYFQSLGITPLASAIRFIRTAVRDNPLPSLPLTAFTLIPSTLKADFVWIVSARRVGAD